jgi:hypothetical protein
MQVNSRWRGKGSGCRAIDRLFWLCLLLGLALDQPLIECSRYSSGSGCRHSQKTELTLAVTMKCPKCRIEGLYRIERHGFLRRKIWPLFGLYPWECKHCRKVTLLRSRGVRQSTPHPAPPRRDYRHLNLRPSQARSDSGDADYQEHVNRAARLLLNQ